MPDPARLLALAEECEQLPVRYVLAPALPAEPPPGFVRARFPIAVGADGQWCVSAASAEQESESIEATDWFRREGHPSRISFITADAPLPSQPAEIVGALVTP